MPDLTPRQSKILQFIRQTIDQTAQAPSVREIARQFGIRSPNGVSCHLLALERKGAIVRMADVHRGIKLAERAAA